MHLKSKIDSMGEMERRRLALRLMDDKNLGAVLTRLGWTWPNNVRTSDDSACAVLEALAEPTWQDGDCLLEP